jgi:hypothetical protein
MSMEVDGDRWRRPSAKVAPGLEPVDDRGGELAAAGPVLVVDEFKLQGVEQALGHGIVLRILDRLRSRLSTAVCARWTMWSTVVEGGPWWIVV